MTWRGSFAFLLAIACAVGGRGSAVADEGACRGVLCSGHGACMLERDEPFCLCDDGYAASELRCEPAPAAPEHEARRRAATMGGRIVYVAQAETGRGPAFVGASLTTEPYALSRYLRPREMWCSDFVSWVYRVAGVPFTGGYEGGWRLTNNYAIRRWFQRRGLWVDHDSLAWATFTPMPGDYVRLHTTSGHGHSAIVRYAMGDTLYTIEGNVGNTVRTGRYHRFRQHRRIDGVGFVTMPDARRSMLARLAPLAEGTALTAPR